MSAELQQLAPQQLWRRQVADRLGAADLATDATTGFLQMPSCPGTPTGTPDPLPVGVVPMVFDSVGKLLYGYVDGVWELI